MGHPTPWHDSPPLRRTGQRTLCCKCIQAPHRAPGRCPHSGRGWLRRAADTWEAEEREAWTKLLPPLLPLVPKLALYRHQSASRPPAWLGPAS